MEYTINEIKFTDADIVEVDNYIPAGEYNPHNVHPWLLHNHGHAVCVVFASNLQDALDIAVDENKLDAFMISEEDYGDYGVTTDEPTCAFLGNASEPFDIDGLSYLELPNPPMSWVAMFAADDWPTGTLPKKDAARSPLISHPAAGRPPREHRVIQLD
jgi:hypothetical protein